MTDAITPFGYKTQDVRRNREGHLSAGQRRQLTQRWLVTVLGGVALVFAPIVLAWILILWGTGDNFAAVISQAWLGYLIGLLLGILYAAVNFRSLLLGLDLLRGIVKPVSGMARMWGEYLIVGQDRFVIEQRELIQDGLQYRVFFLPASRTVLSIEFSE